MTTSSGNTGGYVVGLVIEYLASLLVAYLTKHLHSKLDIHQFVQMSELERLDFLQSSLNEVLKNPKA